ncbi:hypothetical protein KDAU_64410 [Dictyobacter aurantiacus]|uniref:Uncharacterized protein n=1 Tax=Dictyobacter aurantiacus TaxID=1936993 RepID=A0A401ZQK7_9CHLR|nr:hypothetical protein KDAU_64410 [Dictyobacter aurantiacus]
MGKLVGAGIELLVADLGILKEDRRGLWTFLNLLLKELMKTAILRKWGRGPVPRHQLQLALLGGEQRHAYFLIWLGNNCFKGYLEMFEQS